MMQLLLQKSLNFNTFFTISPQNGTGGIWFSFNSVPRTRPPFPFGSSSQSTTSSQESTSSKVPALYALTFLSEKLFSSKQAKT